MKLTKSASGKYKLTKQAWEEIGKQAGWGPKGVPIEEKIEHEIESMILSETYDEETDMGDYEKRALIWRKVADWCNEMAAHAAEDATRERDIDIEDNLSDVDADAMTLRDVGWGTDEDYGPMPM
jgi:hypothetical protein